MMAEKKSTFVPNSFQTPNAYVDDLMPYLSDSEFKVLIYAVRRILGFQKRQDRISISQFTEGTKARDGSILDTGTGLGIGTVKNCLENLVTFGIMVKLADNDPRTNEGTLWSLQWDPNDINWKGLQERLEKQEKANAARMAKARSVRQSAFCPTEPAPPSGTEPAPPSGTETQNTGFKSSSNTENTLTPVFIWESILAALFLTVPRNTYTFLQSAKPVSFENDILTLGAIDELSRDWLSGNAKAAIEKTFPAVIQRAAKVEFVLQDVTL